MDFGSLLSQAQKNGQGANKEIKYYSTKFEPPKKEQRSKKLSVNIQKFLARKEEEEKQKTHDANKRRDQLLELRSKDKKATRRVNVMLKRTKSANQSVIQDAVDSDNTAVTMAGTCQPDEDDYGYVSQNASEFYNKMMEKYSKMPDEPKFSLGKKKVSTNLSNTKDRVRAALEKADQEANQPHRRKRKRENGDAYEYDKVEENREEKKEVKKPNLKPAPVINFSDLLKLAEKKQFEPIVMEQKKEKDDERLLTKKQKREAEREKEMKEAKEKREQARMQGSVSAPLKRIPKLGEENKPKTSSAKPPPPSQKPEDKSKLRQQLTKSTDDRNGKRPEPKRIPSKDADRREPSSVAKVRPEYQSKPKEFPPRDLKKPVESNNRSKQVFNGQRPKQFPPSDLKPKQFPPSDIRPKQFPPRDLKEKRFPPEDVRRKRKPIINKGRFYDDDSEYDSEMDDFIDDGPSNKEEDYSKYITEIFGYDKRKYQHIDDDVDNMESTFAQQMREEVISAKMGIREDLEDMKMEEEHKKRKAMMKRKYR